ncbi:hypothetical protein Ocin01_14754, partial [Orchesella cincta]
MRNGFFWNGWCLMENLGPIHCSWNASWDPLNYQTMIMAWRKAWTASVCLATEPYPHTVTFEQNFNIGKIIGGSEDGHTLKLSPPSDQKNGTVTAVTVQCIPFYSLVAAMNVTVVDYFSLDVESYPWSLFTHTRGKLRYKHNMEEQGYVTAKNARYRVDEFTITKFMN